MIDEEKIIQKILNHEELSKEEVEYVFYEFEEIDYEVEENRRWSHIVNKIFFIEGRFFSIWGDVANTEYQEDYFEPQTLIEVEQREKTITVWEAKE